VTLCKSVDLRRVATNLPQICRRALPQICHKFVGAARCPSSRDVPTNLCHAPQICRNAPRICVDLWRVAVDLCGVDYVYIHFLCACVRVCATLCKPCSLCKLCSLCKPCSLPHTTNPQQRATNPHRFAVRGGGLGSRPIFKKFNEPYAMS